MSITDLRTPVAASRKSSSCQTHTLAVVQERAKKKKNSIGQIERKSTFSIPKEELHLFVYFICLLLFCFECCVTRAGDVTTGVQLKMRMWHATGARRGKTSNRQPVIYAGKHATGDMRGRNMQPVTCKGKHATANRLHTRENIQSVPRAGKHPIGAKRGKTCN